LVSYVIAIKRTSTVLGVLWGHYLFAEPGVRERLSGALIMLAGMLLIILR
ncbi:MAG: EamA family transporter, partial [Desulfuromonadales bacterium]|nr:EamA family transporter [Desulfuromonadales bacterium]